LRSAPLYFCPLGKGKHPSFPKTIGAFNERGNEDLDTLGKHYDIEFWGVTVQYRRQMFRALITMASRDEG